MAGSITAASPRALKPRGRMYEVTDAHLPGFLVRVLASGKKVSFVRHRASGRDDRVRLGIWSDSLPLDEALRQAMAVLAGGPAPTRGDDRDDDDDERGEREVGRRSGRPRAFAAPASAPGRAPARRTREPLRPPLSQITVRELAGRFEREYLNVYLKPGSAAKYRRHLADHILPAFGDRPFDMVTRAT